MRERGHVLAVGRYWREAGAVGAGAADGRRRVHRLSVGGRVPRRAAVSELATNAVLHSTGPDFCVLCHSPSPLDGSVQVEVHDGGGPPLPRRPATTDEHGRGLALLDLLATTWRTEPTSTGKSLIFTLTRDVCLS